VPFWIAEAAVEARDVAVLGEEHVAALAAHVDARLGDRVRVARRLATDDERDARDVALRRAAEALDAVRRLRQRLERLVAEDLLADAEDVAVAERRRLVAA
jgi:hypothetical protein